MCTALNLTAGDHYFGRTLDLDCSYGEQVVVMPRNFPLPFRFMGAVTEHFAMIGMATVMDGYPLFYDAVNEHGLAMAGLNFPSNAYYPPAKDGCDNVPPFEFIPWILSQAKTVDEARALISRINLSSTPFSENVPLSPLHWIVSDKNGSVVVESMRDGLRVHENPAGVMTNNPPFEFQLFNLNNYRGLNVENGENTFSPDLPLDKYCQGLGLIGLPGDVSSMSRFVRASFGAAHSVTADESEADAVGQFFHILSSVEMPRGICKTDGGEWDITVYTSCVNTARGIYYYTAYTNRRISAVDMHKCGLDGEKLVLYPLNTAEDIYYVN